MSTVEDLRKSLEKLVIPDLQALKGAVEANEKASKLRDDALSEKIDQKFDLLAQRISELSEKVDLKLERISTRMEAIHAMVMTTLSLEFRMASLERNQDAEKRQQGLDTRPS